MNKFALGQKVSVKGLVKILHDKDSAKIICVETNGTVTNQNLGSPLSVIIRTPDFGEVAAHPRQVRLLKKKQKKLKIVDLNIPQDIQSEQHWIGDSKEVVNAINWLLQYARNNIYFDSDKYEIRMFHSLVPAEFSQIRSYGFE